MEKYLLFYSILIMFILVSSNIRTSFSYTSFLFGDSLVDAGNNDYIFTLSKANSPPYGIDFQPSGGKPTGRFTNGRTVSDLLGEALGAKSFPQPFLSPTTLGKEIFNGVNYASGASGILDETGTSFVGRIPLKEQINYFELNRASMVTKVGENGTLKFLKGTVFSVTAGSNDFLNYFQPNIPFSGEDHKVSPATLQDFLVGNLTIQLKRLYKLGARKFIVDDVGPLGCIPFVRTLKLIPEGKCSIEANKLIQEYNKKLKKALDELNKILGPETIFVFANTYDIVSDIIQQYQKYGFENAYDPCCSGRFLPFICFKGQDENTSSILCDDRWKYVFWDAYHPTEATNIIIAEKLLSGDESICYPINVRELYNYNL